MTENSNDSKMTNLADSSCQNSSRLCLLGQKNKQENIQRNIDQELQNLLETFQTQATTRQITMVLDNLKSDPQLMAAFLKHYRMHKVQNSSQQLLKSSITQYPFIRSAKLPTLPTIQSTLYYLNNEGYDDIDPTSDENAVTLEEALQQIIEEI